MMITAAPPRRPNRNRRVMIGLYVWFILAATAFALIGIRNQEYRSQFTVFRNEIRTLIAATPFQLKQAKEAGDMTKTISILNDLSAALSQKNTSAPHILGVHLGLEAEVKKQNAISVAAKDYAENLKETAQIIEYQRHLSHNLQTLSLKDAADYEQTIALADAWHEAANPLQPGKVPPKLADIITVLSQKAVVIESRIRELAELYKQTNAAGFTTKQRELASIIDEMKPLGAQISAISVAMDTELRQSYIALQQNL